MAWTSKGVFITTSDFSPQAREFAEGASPRIILISGWQLAELMIEHDVGVTVEQSYEIKRIDLDYFVQDEDAITLGDDSAGSAAQASPSS
jgi:restriction system protein